MLSSPAAPATEPRGVTPDDAFTPVLCQHHKYDLGRHVQRASRTSPHRSPPRHTLGCADPPATAVSRTALHRPRGRPARPGRRPDRRLPSGRHQRHGRGRENGAGRSMARQKHLRGRPGIRRPVRSGEHHARGVGPAAVAAGRRRGPAAHRARGAERAMAVDHRHPLARTPHRRCGRPRTGPASPPGRRAQPDRGDQPQRPTGTGCRRRRDPPSAPPRSGGGHPTPRQLRGPGTDRG